MVVSMVIASTPRVRCVRRKDPVSQLPSTLQKKWERRADRHYEEVCTIYLEIAQKCLWWNHVIHRSRDKKKRQDAKKSFLKMYPTMMALTQIGMDIHLPFGVPKKLDQLYYHLNTH